MRVRVDGDGCPDLNEIIEICVQNDVEVYVYVDYAHRIDREDCTIITCDVGADSVDYEIINSIQKDDLLITQDYGLASLVLLRGAKVLHVSSKVIDSNNIDEMLNGRYLSFKERQATKKCKGPKARNDDVRKAFLTQLKKMIDSGGGNYEV